MRNIKIDPVTGGFVFAGGVLQGVDAAASIEQGVRCALKTFAGEYFLDDPQNPQVGVPYLQRILRKNADPRVVDAVVRKVILGVQGVSKVVSLNFSYDKATRKLSAAWQAQTDTGLINGSTAVSA